MTYAGRRTRTAKHLTLLSLGDAAFDVVLVGDLVQVDCEGLQLVLDQGGADRLLGAALSALTLLEDQSASNGSTGLGGGQA